MSRLLVAGLALLLASPASAHYGVSFLDAHLGGMEKVVKKRMRKTGCVPLSHKRHPWQTDWNHRRVPRPKRGGAMIYRCQDKDWPEASLRELHFDGKRLHRVVVHFELAAEKRDPATGAPFIPKYRELRAALEGRLGKPDEVREEMPRNFGTDQLRALEQRRGGFWAVWYNRLRKRIDLGIRLSGNPERPGEVLFYVDARDRRTGKKILKRRTTRIQPTPTH